MKRLLVALMAISMLSIVAYADAPPANGLYGGGWGINPNDWETTGGPWAGSAIVGEGGGELFTPGSTSLSWPTMDINLWVETCFDATYDVTDWNIHQVGNSPANYELIIHATLAQNCASMFQLLPAGNAIGSMPMIHGGPYGMGYPGDPIPILWDIAVLPPFGNGEWNALNAGNNWQWTSGFSTPCQHAFWLRVRFSTVQCQAGGHYTYAAILCPASAI